MYKKEYAIQMINELDRALLSSEAFYDSEYKETILKIKNKLKRDLEILTMGDDNIE